MRFQDDGPSSTILRQSLISRIFSPHESFLPAPSVPMMPTDWRAHRPGWPPTPKATKPHQEPRGADAGSILQPPLLEIFDEDRCMALLGKWFGFSRDEIYDQAIDAYDH